VSSGNGGEENCSSVNTFAHVESSPQSVVVTICSKTFLKYFKIMFIDVFQICSICLNID
jgi:hypothetical protein